MLQLFENGGVFMYFILLVSIVALALFCERANFLYLQLKLNIESQTN